jgi:O-antigen/teichoic acid export membrane protein
MLKKSIVYLAIVYLMQVLSIILNILLIRNLSLENLGQITLAKVYFQFMEYTHLGSRFAMDRFVPTHTEKAGKKITIFTMNISVIISIVTIGIVYLFINDDLIILVFMISGFAYTMASTYKAYFRAKEDTGKMLAVILTSIFFPLIIQVIVIYFFDFNTFVATFFASYMLGFVLLVYKFRLIQLMSATELIIKIKSLYKDISLLFLTSLVIFLSFSIDKILLENYKGKEALGEYSIIMFVFATLLVIPSTLNELIFPRIIKKITETSKLIHLKENLFMLLPTLLAIGLSNLVMDFFIIKFTAYSYLLSYLHLASWAVLPFAFTPIFYHTLNALDQRQTILKINALVMIIYIGYLYIILFYSDISMHFKLGGLDFTPYQSNDILQNFVWGRILYGILLIIFYIGYLMSYNLTSTKKS